MNTGNSILSKRPKPGESEEEILAQERQFLESVKNPGCVPPAAKVIKCYDKKGNNPKPKADISDEVTVKNKIGEVSADLTAESTKSERAEKEIAHPLESVLHNIKENQFDSNKLKGFGIRTLPKIVPTEISFNERKLGSKKAGKSLFARTFDAVHSSPASAATSEAKIPSCSKQMDTREQIAHPILAEMKEEEILAAQQELLQRLDPDMVRFIKSRSQSKIQAGTKETDSKVFQNPNKMDVDTPLTKFDVTDLPINPQEVSNFPRMNVLESEKLTWAGVIKSTPQSFKEEQKIPQSSDPNEIIEGRNARFDFDGNYIVDGKMSENLTFNRGLHCHGEEMERAGYSFEELLTLMRSSNSGQRSLAMETIANIFEKAHTGLYDGCFDKSLFQLINELDFMHSVRVAIDHADTTSVNSAFKCLCEIIYPYHEEICLDIVYLWSDSEPHPWLSTNTCDVNTIGKDEKDFEVLQSDMLQFLIQRSDLLLRIGYFFRNNSDNLNEHGVKGILKILVRIARHSPNVLVESSDIMNYLVKNHVSANWRLVGSRPSTLRGVPLQLAFKIIRILADSSARNAEILYNKYDFFPTLMSYLAYFEWKDQNLVLECEELILECFKVWTAFLSHGLAINEYTSFFPILMQFLQYYEAATKFSSFDIAHATHVFTLLRSVLNVSEREDVDMEHIHSHWPLVKCGAEFVSNFVRKMLFIITSKENAEPNDDLTLLSVAQGLTFLISASQHGELNLESLNRSVEVFLKSNFYKCNTNLLRKHSVILHNQEMDNKRYPANVATTGAYLYQGKLNPMISSGSPYHFLTVLIKYMKAIKTFPSKLTMDDGIKAYLQEICKRTESSMDCNFYVRFEIAFVDELLDFIEEEKFAVAYKMISEVPVCLPHKYTSLLKKILLNFVDNEEFIVALCETYSKSLTQQIATESSSTSSQNKKKVTFQEPAEAQSNKETNESILFAQWTTKLTKKYWIFEPLDEMYKMTTQINGYVENNLHLVEKQSRIFLQFILRCLENFRDVLIIDTQDLVMIYSRICQIFVLGDPRVYIDEVNTPTLRSLLKTLMDSPVMVANCSAPIFSTLKPTTELSASFFDIYADLVREFHDNSYFNELFASFLLLPLRPAEDARIKKIFWTAEHINCVRISVDKVDLPMSWFTSQVETDPEIIKLFWQLYKSGKIANSRNPLLFEIIKLQLLAQEDKMSCREDFSKLRL